MFFSYFLALNIRAAGTKTLAAHSVCSPVLFASLDCQF
jgi:hypothetical protein